MKVRDRRTSLGVLLTALFAALALMPGFAFSQASFFQGKTITVIQGRDPGGTGDLRVKALFPFLQKYIPGNPNVVSEYMPGGGSRKAANHVYRSARPDGLTIGNFSSAVVSLAVLGESGVLYDIDKFFYLGSPYSTYHAVFVTRKQLGLTNIEKLQTASGLRIGASVPVAAKPSTGWDTSRVMTSKPARARLMRMGHLQ